MARYVIEHPRTLLSRFHSDVGRFFFIDPELGKPVRRGDTLLLRDPVSREAVSIDVLESRAIEVGGLALHSIGYLSPTSRTVRQIELTNRTGQTSVLWVEDSKRLRTGVHLRLWNDLTETVWRISTLCTTLRPKDVPDEAKIGFVLEILDVG